MADSATKERLERDCSTRFPEAFEQAQELMDALKTFHENEDHERLVSSCAGLAQLLQQSPALAPYLVQCYPRLLPGLISSSTKEGAMRFPVLQSAVLLIDTGLAPNLFSEEVEDRKAQLATLVENLHFSCDDVNVPVARGLCRVLTHAVTVPTASDDVTEDILTSNVLWVAATSTVTTLLTGLTEVQGLPLLVEDLATLLRRCCGASRAVSSDTVGQICAWASAFTQSEVALFPSTQVAVQLLLCILAVSSDASDSVEMLRSTVADVSNSARGSPTTPLRMMCEAILEEVLFPDSVDPETRLHVAELNALLEDLRALQTRNDADLATCLEKLCRVQALMEPRDQRAEDDATAAETAGQQTVSTAVANMPSFFLLWLLPNALRTLLRCVDDAEKEPRQVASRLLRQCVELPGIGPRAVAELICGGALAQIEKWLSSAYSTDVGTTAALLLQNMMHHCTPPMRNAAVSSGCWEVMGLRLHEIATGDDVEGFVKEVDNAGWIAAMLGTLGELTPEEMVVVTEDLVADVSTFASAAKEHPAVLHRCLDLLPRLAKAHPLAASMTVDFDFLQEQLAIPDPPNEVNAAFIVASLQMMAAIASEQSAAVTFEWIEILVAAFQRSEEWKSSVPGYAHAVWNCLLTSLTSSEDSGQYFFDEPTVTTAVKDAMAQCADGKAEPLVVPVVVRVAQFSLASSTELACEFAQSVHAVAVHPAYAQLAVKEAVVEFCDTVKDVIPASLLVATVLDAVCHDIRTFTGPDDFQRYQKIQEDGARVLHDTAERSAPELLLILQDAAKQDSDADQQPQKQQTDAEAPAPTSDETAGDTHKGAAEAHGATTLMATQRAQLAGSCLGGILQAHPEARTSATRDALTDLAFSCLDEARSAPLGAMSCAILLRALSSAYDIDPSDSASATAVRKLFDRDFLGVCANLIESTRRRHGPGSAEDQVVTQSVYSACEHLLPLQGKSPDELCADQHLVRFIKERVLCDMAHIHCGNFLLLLLNYDPLRKTMAAADKHTYLEALSVLAMNCGPGPLQLRFSLYRKEAEETS